LIVAVVVLSVVFIVVLVVVMVERVLPDRACMAQSRGSTDDGADSVAMASHPTATASAAGRMRGAVASFRQRSVPLAHTSAWSHRQGSTRRNAGTSAATGST
jgi:hypothetical protein